MSTTTTLSELTGNYVLDLSRTRIGFVARHTMGTKVRGQFEQYEGSAHFDGEDPSKSGARLTVQAKSIRTGNRQRDDHLCGTFLDVDHHPTFDFASTTVQRLDDTVFRVTGDLTRRGVTQPVTVDLELTGAENDPRGGFQVCFKGSIVINRNDWGVNWNAATRMMVSPKVVLDLDIAAITRT